MKRSWSRLSAIFMALILGVMSGCGGADISSETPTAPVETVSQTPNDLQSGSTEFILAGTSWYSDVDGVIYCYTENGELQLYAEADDSWHYGSYTWDAAAASGAVTLDDFTTDIYYDADNAELFIIGEDGKAYSLEPYEPQQELDDGQDDSEDMTWQDDMLSGTCWDNDEAEVSIVFDNGAYVASTTLESFGGTYIFDGTDIELTPDVGSPAAGSISDESLLTIDGVEGCFVTVAEPTYVS